MGSMRFYRLTQYCRKFVLVLLSVLWHVLVNVYCSLLLLYEKWSAGGFRTPGIVGVGITAFVVISSVI